MPAAATVGDLMSTDLVTVSPATTVAEAATLMGQRRVGSCLVIEGGTLVGIFTERDIVKVLGQHFDASGHDVGEWMTAQPTTVAPGAVATEALQVMISGGFRHLPVMDGSRLVGMVSMRDLSGALSGG